MRRWIGLIVVSLLAACGGDDDAVQTTPFLLVEDSSGEAELAFGHTEEGLGWVDATKRPDAFLGDLDGFNGRRGGGDVSFETSTGGTVFFNTGFFSGSATANTPATVDFNTSTGGNVNFDASLGDGLISCNLYSLCDFANVLCNQYNECDEFDVGLCYSAIYNSAYLVEYEDALCQVVELANCFLSGGPTADCGRGFEPEPQGPPDNFGPDFEF